MLQPDEQNEARLVRRRAITTSTPISIKSEPGMTNEPVMAASVAPETMAWRAAMSLTALLPLSSNLHANGFLFAHCLAFAVGDMVMKIRRQIALIALSACAVAAVAASPPVHVQGVIQSVDRNTVTVNAPHGGMVKVRLNESTRYFRVMLSSPSKIHQGDYVGLASHQVDNRPVVTKVIIFPTSLRGVGDGHHVSTHPLHRARPHGAKAAPGVMAGGTVSGAAESGSTVQRAMTNGSVASLIAGAHGLHMTVTYNGRHNDFMIPSSSRVVILEPSDASILDRGAQVFIVTKHMNGQRIAKVVTVTTPSE